MDSLFDCERYHDLVLAYHAGRFAGVGTGPHYGMNLELPDCLLEEVPWNIRPSRNKLLGPSPAVNIPIMYIAGDGSYTPFHPEDGYLDSCNLLCWDPWFL